MDLENLYATAKQEHIGQVVSELLSTYFSETLLFKVIEGQKIDKIIRMEERFAGYLHVF